MLTEMIGDPWNPTPQPKDKPPQVRGVHITLERQIKCGGTKGCSACFGQAKVHSPERQRLWTMKLYRQQPRAQLTPMSRPQGQAAGGPTPSSSSGPALAAGGPAPEDVNMEVAADSSAAQPTSSAVGAVGG